MIAVLLRGGLGNQMFQYAMGLHLATRHGTELVLDTSFLDGEQPGCTVRLYELDQLSIQARRSSRDDIFRELSRHRPSLRYALSRIASSFGRQVAPPFLVREEGFAFNPDILDAPDNVYMDGYWQSERYFLDIREQLLQHFQPIQPLSGHNAELAEQISSGNAVSVHVRRGDYVSDQKTAEFHGSCSIDYYRRAFEIIHDKVAEPHYYFFSDDIDWVRDNLDADAPVTYVDHNAGQGQEDMRLMSLCAHHVIANSSFSWWAAWLGRNPWKVVVAPEQWFIDVNFDTSDVVPESWRVVPN